MEGAQTLPSEIKRTLFFRQIGFLLAVAGSVALAVYVALWSQTPNYSLLYGSLSHQDIAQVMDSLQKANIKYRVDETSGAVMVPSSKLHEARMKLATDGLPRNANAGYGVLQEDQGLGTSQFIEKARYQHAMEMELARSISEISSVRSARVHLALPKQSVFVRNRKPVSASVLVNLYSGHQLAAGQVAAISNLVAASVPNLDIDNVSIVDQNGRLMTQNGSAKDFALTASQFQYVQNFEQSYTKRIEDILVPILGPGGVKAQVTADFDFTQTEQTRESYNPDLPAVRSEHLEEDVLPGNGQVSGVPGALSNQPPISGTLDETEQANGNNNAGNGNGQDQKSNRQRRTTRNYELDKTISHTKLSMGKLRRLSVAVVIDYKKILDDKGKVTRVEHTPEEIESFITLVKEAIGFEITRGDTVNVMNTEFALPDVPEPLPEVPIWKQPWVWDISKQVAGALFVLFIVFGVLKPALKNLLKKEITLHQAALSTANAPSAALPQGQQMPDNQQANIASTAQAQLTPPAEYTGAVNTVREIVKDDPRAAATVVKNWVGEE